MVDENRERIARALELVIAGLQPFVAETLSAWIPTGQDWTAVLEAKDNAAGIRGKIYRSNDLQALLRMLTERIGNLGYPFQDRFGRAGQRLASELRDVRNEWAHNETFSDDDTVRALDTAERLLTLIGRQDLASEARRIRADLLPIPTVGDAPAREPDVPSVDEVVPAAAPAERSTEPTIPPGAIGIIPKPILSYAAAHNRIQVVDSLVVPPLEQDMRGASLRLRVEIASGTVSEPWERTIDLRAGEERTIRDVDMHLRPDAALAVDVRQPAAIVAELVREGAVVAQGRQETTMLAASGWEINQPQLSAEILAAFAQPNHPAIEQLLHEASDILRTRTGSGALDGYQSGDADRVDQVADAIYLAMKARDIRYAEPPASWNDGVQHVRTPGDVLDGHVGTCLDTTLTFAAALEQAGVHPLLWLVPHHIFVGYWRVDSSMGAIATREALDLMNYFDLGAFAVFETTMTTGGGTDDDSAAARRKPVIDWLRARAGEVIAVTDIHEARQAGILPLPARSVAADGTVQVVEYRPADRVTRPYEEYEKTAPDALKRRAIPPRVQQWKNALLDLSLRNRLINFTERAGLNLAVVGSDLGFLEDLVNDGKPLTLRASDEVPEIARQRGLRFGRDLAEQDRSELLRARTEAFVDVTGAVITTRLRALAYRARTIEQETGANNLYLALGTLEWTFNDKPLRSPLVLVPVKLQLKRGDRYAVVLDETGTSTPNYCLLEKLRQAHGLRIPGLAEPALDGAGIDLDAAFRGVREELAEAGLPYRVAETADLAILQFAKYRLWKDLDEHWDEFAKNPLVQHLIESPTEPFTDPGASMAAGSADLDELAALCPVPADASQLSAIGAAVAGETFVLEGPPGTGKSQTITNLLVRSLAAGRRVLFVAEKRAALTVVQKRLAEVGFGTLALDLHDKGSRPAAVREQLKQALQQRARSDRDGLGIAAEALATARQSLARYAERLHEPNAIGLSLYAARNRQLLADRDIPTIEVPDALVADAARVDEIRRVLRDLSDVADPARPAPLHPWGFVTASAATSTEQLIASVAQFRSALDALPVAGPVADIVEADPTSESLELTVTLATAPRLDEAAVTAASESTWRSAASSALATLERFASEWPGRLPIVSPAVLDQPLAALHRDALAADQTGFFGRRHARKAIRERLRPLVRPDAMPTLRALSALTAELDRLANAAEGVRSAVAAVPALEVTVTWNPLVNEDREDIRRRHSWLMWLSDTLVSQALPPRVRAAASRLWQTLPPDSELAARLQSYRESLADLQSAVTPDALVEWRGEESLVSAWWRTETGRSSGDQVAALDRWRSLVRHVVPVEAAGLGSARRDILSGRLPAELASAAFEQGLADTSVRERSEATTLDTFSTEAHTRTIERYAERSGEVRDRLVSSIPADVVSSRAFDPDAGGGQVGELRRQLDRQRGGYGVRALFEHYAELILQLTPCVLMSPESVSRFLGADNDLFDVVVFDEASQVRVADAIGAMGRGRSVVVVGDSKQMPPTSFAEASAATGDDDRGETTGPVVADEESILSECVAARVQSRALTWHYRSQDESLIRFSNEHYYGNLSSFPSPLHGRADDGIDGHGISLVRVAGTFLRSGAGKELRTNPVEAAAIVDEIERRFWGSPDAAPSLGVITFNAQQRELIEALLRDAGDPRITQALEEDDGLFVKNLENVQGDERDTILFSVAFSANDNGVVPLNFGPLTQAGGERRLNVAITRARRQVILFASFDPADLRTEETASIGVKHLREYLELAKSGGELAAGPRAHDDFVDRHREEIAGELRMRGYAVATDVGLSEFKIDLSVATASEPDRPVAAVLLDSPAWARRRTVGDRDGLPIEVLENLMRWPTVQRVWMPSWLENHDAVLDQLGQSIDDAALVGEIDAALEAAPVQATKPVDSSADLVDRIAAPTRSMALAEERLAGPGTVVPPLRSAQPPVSAPVSSVSEFRPWVVRRAGSVAILDALPARSAERDVEQVVREVVEHEAPVHIVRLAKLVAAAFGLDRVAQARVTSIVRAIPLEMRGTDHMWIWPPSVNSESWTAYRTTPMHVSRPLEHVHPIEIANAMRDFARRSAGLYEDELRRSTLNAFGATRMTPNMIALLDGALKLGLGTNRLAQDEAGRIVLGRASAGWRA